MNKQKFTAQIEVEAIISQAQKELAKLGKDVNKSWQNGSPPKGMLKQLESMRTRLTSLQNLTSSGVIDSSGLSSAKNDFKGLSKEIRQLTIEYQLFTTEQKKAMLSQEEQNAMRARAAAMDAYTESIKRNAKARKEEKEALGTQKLHAEAKKKQLESLRAGKQHRIDNLSDIDTKQAEAYLNNLKEAKKLREEITDLEAKISKHPTGRGVGKAQLEQETKQLEEKREALKKIDLLTGKESGEKLVQKQTLEIEVEEATADIKAVEVEIQNLSNAIKGVDTKDLNKLKDALQKCGVEGIENIDNFDDLKQKIQQLDEEALSRVDNAVQDFIKQLKKMEKQTDQVGVALDQANDSIKDQEAAMARMNAIEDRIKSLLGFTGAVEVLKTSARHAIATIKELDETMTEMAVVTDLTVGDYWDQLPEYSQRASELGVSINSAYKAATLYYQQGLKTNEVTAISAETLKMARIAGLDASTATDKMTAALRGFNMELNETSAQRVSDVYSELAAITAADTKEIANAMTKTASIASNAGMEFETTAAFLSQIIETTRESAETAGTAMKTVIARFQELKKDPAEIGEVDGEIVDANKIETALRSVGVSLRDANGQFRDLDDVFLELSSKWATLDTNTQRYIATIAAGSRQQSRFIAMMSDYGRTQELVAAANNSAGASSRQFEKTMDSLQSKLAKLKNAWDEFTMGIMNSDLVKTGVDILTKFLEVVNKATNGLTGIGNSITKIVGILAVFKVGQAVFAKLEKPIISFVNKIISQAGIAGEKSGKAYIDGLEKAKKKATTEKQTNKYKDKLPEGVTMDASGRLRRDGKWIKKEEQDAILKEIDKNNATDSFKDKAKQAMQVTGNALGDKIGLTKINDGRKELAQISAARKKTAKQMAEIENLELNKQIGIDLGASAEEIAAIDKKIKEANKSLSVYQKEQLEIEKKAGPAWKSIGEGVSQAGSAITGFGVGVSVVGGLLSSLGLEEVGDWFAKIGNYILIAGTAITALGPIITTVSTIAQAAGIKTLAAWGWVGLIVAGIALLVAGVCLIFKQIEDNSPEKKLERAQAAADGAAKGAERAAEAYNNLADSLDSINDKYDSLQNMIRGTEEWNKATQDVNNSVLDLINQYSELAAFVSNEGGVLTIGTDSAEVQDILRAYKANEVKAKGAEIGTKSVLAQANLDYELDTLDDKTFEKFQTEGQTKATLTAWGNLLTATKIGTYGGAALGAGTGALIGGKVGTVAGTAVGGVAGAGVGAAPGAAVGAGGGVAAGAGIGAIIGAIIGTVGGFSAGVATFQSTVDQVEKQNETNRKNVETLAQAYAKGETGTTFEEIVNYIERNEIAFGGAAEQMANALLSDTGELLEFGQHLNAVDEQQKAYYQAMALNAQQLLDLGKYNEHQMNQINTIVDEDLMKNYEEAEKERLQAQAEESSDKEFDKAKEDFAKSIYGDKVRVDGNKIIDEKGETLREFEDDEAWIQEIAMANATQKAAEAMEEIPGAVLNSIKDLGPTLQEVFEKAFEGKSLNKAELEAFKGQLGTITYRDEEGEKATTWEELSAEEQAVWENNEKAYYNSFDKDYSAINEMWKNLTPEQKKAYGWNGDVTDKESLDKAKEAYEDTFIEIIEAGEKAFEEVAKAEEALEINISDQLSAIAAQGWGNNLLNVSAGAATGEIDALNFALNDLISGLESEQVDLVMSEINAMDKMDIKSWDNLADIFSNLNINYATEALNDFVAAGKAAYNAIRKIDFSTLNTDINNIYKTIEKVKKGERTYSEADYKEIIAGNKSLEKDFTQIGDEFIYVGGTIEELTAALEENTVAIMGEANRQLKARGAMANIVEQESNKYASVDTMGDMDLMSYITDMRQAFADQGLNISDLGIEGLTNLTDISKASSEQLKTWASAIALEGGKVNLYEQDYEKKLREANIQRYTHNDTSYNAKMAVEGGEYADEHQRALIIQAVQSGGVSNDMIKAYEEAIESGDESLIKDLGGKIAEATDRIVEANTNRDAYKELIDRVANALRENAQKEIDKLSELNDNITNTNGRLIDKIQEQINYNREQDQLKEQKDALSNLYSQQAYLSADTSGMNALESKQLDEDIQNAEQDLQDTLIDQALQQLSDANERAAEQRERQIALMEEQLTFASENGELIREAEAIVSASINELRSGFATDQTEMYKLLFGEETKGLSTIATEKWASDLQIMATSAQNWLSSQNGGKTENVSGEATSDTDSGGESVPDKDKQNRDNALAAAKKALESATGGGYLAQSEDANSELNKAFQVYKDAGGVDNGLEAFAKEAMGDGDIHQNDFKVVGKTTDEGNNWNAKDLADGKSEQGTIEALDENNHVFTYRVEAKSAVKAATTVAETQGIDDGAVFTYRQNGYVFLNGTAYKITKTKKSGDWEEFTAFETGGMADFTGPAWLDGTKSRPELVLNARDTQNFIQLKDILAEIMDKGGMSDNSTSNGDNYFDIQINVEDISDDYDVEQLANKIRSMIYEDATYRNVNAVSHISR